MVIDKQGRTVKSDEAIELDIILPEPLRVYNGEYDEILYENDVWYTIRRIGVDENHNLYILDEAVKEVISNIKIPTLDNATYIYVKEYVGLSYYAYYIKQNEYEKVLATKAYVNSSIVQTSNSILEEVNLKYTTKDDTKEIKATLELKVDVDKLISEINASADVINLIANRLIIDSTNFKLTKEGKITATSGKVGGFELTSTNFKGNLSGIYKFGLDDVCLAIAHITGMVTLSSALKSLYDLNGDGNVNIQDVVLMLNIINNNASNSKTVKGTVKINSTDPKNTIAICDSSGNITTSLSIYGVVSNYIKGDYVLAGNNSGSNYTGCILDGSNKKITVTDGNNSSSMTSTAVTAQSINNTSLAELKKNIKEVENVSEIVKNSRIYSFNYNTETDGDKKHYGFVIGEDYETPEQVLSKDKNAIDVYSMCSILWKRVQELEEKIEKGENNGQDCF